MTQPVDSLVVLLEWQHQSLLVFVDLPVGLLQYRQQSLLQYQGVA
ncbi:MAG: hypothetical protein AAF485_07800 [Chloroflexota bacterium]